MFFDQTPCHRFQTAVLFEMVTKHFVIPKKKFYLRVETFINDQQRFWIYWKPDHREKSDFKSSRLNYTGRKLFSENDASLAESELVEKRSKLQIISGWFFDFVIVVT